MICEGSAVISHRFMRLLHKNKFDQAEEFAKQFDLDVEVRLYSPALKSFFSP